MVLCNTRSWSAGDFMREEPGKYMVIEHWILISRRIYTRRTGQACCYITQDLEQQSTLYQTNRASKLLYNTGNWSAGDFIPEESGRYDVI